MSLFVKTISRCFFAAAITVLLPSLSLGSEALLIEFVSTRCRPCQQMAPIVEQLSRSGVAVRKVDVDREADLTQRYGVERTPTYIIVAGGKELTRLVGSQTIEDLQTALAIDPSGPWIDTTSKPVAPSEIEPPKTRLAPLPTSLVPPSPPSLDQNSSGEVMPSLSHADAIQRAQAATVRLRVFDGNGHGAGTGTIVDIHGEEALVLTCGHLFRDTQGKGRIEVDLFVGGEVTTVNGQLIDYDADNRDIALVAIRPGVPVRPVPVINPQDLPSTGDAAFSFGCDRGADPSRRDTRATGVNKYNQDRGGSNLEIAGAPIDGRSGGGLFDRQGRLIGVCNAADYEGDVGIYAGPQSVHWQLDRVQLSHLYEKSASGLANSVNDPQAGLDRLASLESPQNDRASAASSANLVNERLSPDAVPGLDSDELRSGSTFGNASPASGSEVIVIIRDQNDPQAAPKVITLDKPTPELMQLLGSQARR